MFTPFGVYIALWHFYPQGIKSVSRLHLYNVQTILLVTGVSNFLPQRKFNLVVLLLRITSSMSLHYFYMYVKLHDGFYFTTALFILSTIYVSTYPDKRIHKTWKIETPLENLQKAFRLFHTSASKKLTSSLPK